MDLVERAAGRPLKRVGLPWPAVRLMGLFSPLMREVAEMRYLWDRPHQIDGADFHRPPPDFKPTTTAGAVRALLVGCALSRTPALAPTGEDVITA